jgi:hypothetical protein
MRSYVPACLTRADAQSSSLDPPDKGFLLLRSELKIGRPPWPILANT